MLLAQHDAFRDARVSHLDCLCCHNSEPGEVYAPLVYVFFCIQSYFLATSRELKRLDGITRFSLLHLIDENVNGTKFIPSFGMTEQGRELLDRRHEQGESWFVVPSDGDERQPVRRSASAVSIGPSGSEEKNCGSYGADDRGSLEMIADSGHILVMDFDCVRFSSAVVAEADWDLHVAHGLHREGAHENIVSWVHYK